MPDQVAIQQKQLCESYGAPFSSIADDARVAIALGSMALMPLNGLRHPAHGNMCGWYVWGGPYSDNDDFFDVLCVRDLYVEYPTIARFLALPQGYRFLTDGKDHVDVWFDATILSI